MQRSRSSGCPLARTLAGQRGFTLIESIVTASLLGLAAVAIMGVQKNIFSTQTTGRDELVGTELVQACAERILTVRRKSGYINVTNTLCNGMGGISGFASNPTVTFTDSNGNSITTCSTSTCTATIGIAKASGPAVLLRNVTLRLSNY